MGTAWFFRVLPLENSPFPKYELVCWLEDTANLRYPAIRKGTVRYWLFSTCVLYKYYVYPYIYIYHIISIYLTIYPSIHPSIHPSIYFWQKIDSNPGDTTSPVRSCHSCLNRWPASSPCEDMGRWGEDHGGAWGLHIIYCVYYVCILQVPEL